MAQKEISFSLGNVQEAIDYVEENLLSELTPDKIAEHFFVSVPVLAMTFKIACGMTIMEYVRNRRLSLAGEELCNTDSSIIELAYKYGYETPEAFTKAFSRFHGFPPSFVRRAFPITKQFQPMRITITIQGGWENIISKRGDGSLARNEANRPCCKIETEKMRYRKDWNILYSLVRELQKSKMGFKVDGKTMIFAHGLEIPLDKICLTFQWNDEEMVRKFFADDTEVKTGAEGFKYFDVMYQEKKIRCMFYGECPGADTDEFLYRNTDLVQINDITVPVQSLEFYYKNAEKDTAHYKMVEEWLHERVQ